MQYCYVALCLSSADDFRFTEANLEESLLTIWRTTSFGIMRLKYHF
jgi:hypothetical protein